MKNIEELRIFFRLSNATLDYAQKVNTAIGIVHLESEMQQLHRAALVEVEKESPDIGILDGLLEKMQNLAYVQSLNHRKKFTKGGIKL